MAGNYSFVSQNPTNSTALVGWTSTSRDRGSLDILWSSCVTIFLCSWVSTYPNTGSPNDKWYHSLWDKISLALISILGPDVLFGIAYGQFSSARRSVRVRQISPLSVCDFGVLRLTRPQRSCSRRINISVRVTNGRTLTLSSPIWVASTSPAQTSLMAFLLMLNNFIISFCTNKSTFPT